MRQVIRRWRSTPTVIGLFMILASCAGAEPVYAQQRPPAFPPDEDWLVDRAHTKAYPAWLNAGLEVSDDVKSILSSAAGNLQYWIRVPTGAKGTVVVAVGEAHWKQSGQRLMDIVIDGEPRRRRVDPYAAAGGKHRLATIACEAEDLNRDGVLHVQIVASAGTPDKITLAAGIWWFAGKTITDKQARQLVKKKHDLDPDVFIPGVTAEKARAAIDANERFAREAVGRQRQARERTAQYLLLLSEFVHTENDDFNALVRTLYADCVFSKLFDPRPPALPHKWFSPGGPYVGQWLWDTMFVLIAFAPMGEDETIRDVFENYWHTIDKNPEAPKGSPRYGMVPNFLKDWPPVGYSQIPILAWGCLMVYRQTNDQQLIERALPYLVAFDEWYSRERDVDGDGLIEYGAYKPVGQASMLQTARYETFDFHPPMDGMELTKHPKRTSGGAWYGNIDAVEQTCFLLMSERAIVEIARELGQEALADRYETIIARRVKAIRTKMWDQKTRFFYSLDRDTDKKIPVRTIQGFLTLACDAATSDQAADGNRPSTISPIFRKHWKAWSSR